jgi:hypothetical protein
MYYKEFLRVRKAVIVYGIVILSIAVLAYLGAEHVYGSHAHVNLSSNVPMQSMVAAADAGDTTNVQAPGIELHGVSHGSVPMEVLFVIPAFTTALFALVLACFLAGENCGGHLEIAWTRPASRTGYALRGMAVDAVGLAVAYAFTLAVCVAYVSALGFWHYLHGDARLGINIARFVVYPFAWYGVIAAATASLRGGFGLVVGLTWVVAQVLMALRLMNFPPLIHGLLVFINYFNPMTYGSYSDTGNTSHVVLLTSGAAAIGGLLGLAILGTGAALLQWRRLEA